MLEFSNIALNGIKLCLYKALRGKNYLLFSEDEVGYCIVILSTLINREPSLCAPLLPEILLTVTRVIRETQYSWELDSNVYVPQNSRSIAKQFIRCALHQLSGT